MTEKSMKSMDVTDWISTTNKYVGFNIKTYYARTYECGR